MKSIDITSFINSKITFRNDSFLKKDIEINSNLLSTNIYNSSVMVIGGAGTIGSSYIKAILEFNPAKLFVVDINENGLTELTRDLRSNANIKVPAIYKTYPLNFGDSIFYRILELEGPFDIVANFAAHKHVRSEKDQFSVAALIENNVLKAERLLKYLCKNPPAHFFCVSTDKAANPVNIMGASKKLMEELIIAYSGSFPITTARFANVAFSNGSLLDGFLKRLMKRQPFSVPIDVKRYFVSPQESGQICMLACIMGKSGEIFFPKFEESNLTSFRNITEDFVNACGMEVIPFDTEQSAKEYAMNMALDTHLWPVYFFSSDTTGEKAYEEFYTKGEVVDLNRFKSLGVICNAFRKPLTEITEIISRLQVVLKSEHMSKNEIVSLLKEFIPTFSHFETGKNLDQKM
jgi:FlaA1/EpsC-like NDP-sugar epimerase